MSGAEGDGGAAVSADRKRTTSAASATPEEALRAVYAKRPRGGQTVRSGVPVSNVPAASSTESGEAARREPTDAPKEDAALGSKSKSTDARDGGGGGGGRGSLLDSLLTGMRDGEEQRRLAERAVDNGAGSEAEEVAQYQVVANFMRRIADRRYVPEVDEEYTKLEVEVRFGVKHGDANFKSGVERTDFDRLISNLRRKPTLKETFTHDVDYIYDSDDVGRTRLTFDETEKVVTRAERKDPYRNANLDVTLTDFPYDIRFAIASETKLEPPEDRKLPDGWSYRREKERWSFVPEFDWFHVDLTQVTSSGARAGLESVSWEIEFEFSQECVGYAQMAGPKLENAEPEPGSAAAEACDDLEAVAKQFWEFVLLVMGALRITDQDTFSDVALTPLLDEDELQEKRSILYRQIPGCDENNTDFPGSMPVVFSRRHLNAIQSKNYMVSEKTDGIRYLMLMLEDGVFMIDRKNSFYYAQGAEPLLEPTMELVTSGPTIVDGELVRNISTGRPYFMIFDAIVVNGVSVAHKPLTDRLQAIGKVVGKFRDGVKSGTIEGTFPFALIGKQFMLKQQLSKLAHHITTKEGQSTAHIERVYAEPPRDWSRHHKTDGLIFTPVDEPYRPRTVYSLLKWKYVDLLSVDLLVTFRAQGLRQVMVFKVAGYGEDIEMRNIVFSDDDMTKLEQDVRRQRGNPHIIIECTYDTWSGVWKYVMCRPDKHRPNHIVVFVDTLTSIGENVSMQELIYRIAVDPAHDEWRQQLERAVARIQLPGTAGPRPKQHPQQQPQSQ